MNKKVSVIIPTYKRPHFLGRAVDSVLAQDSANVEVVVVDDNMPDSQARASTQELMEKYSDDSRVIYIKNEKSLGGGLARNQGIYKSTGEYVTFLDDDDIYLPNKISVQLNFILENNLEMAFTDVYIYDTNDKLVEFRRHSYINSCENNELLRQHILHSLGPTATIMVKRHVILDAGGFLDVPMGQDFMLMWRMIEHGTVIGYLPGSGVVQYLHEGERISVGKNKVEGENRLYELKKTRLHFLTPQEQKYVKFRHYAVLSISSKRSKKPQDALKFGIYAAMTSPSYAFDEFFKRIKDKNEAQTEYISETAHMLKKEIKTEAIKK